MRLLLVTPELSPILKSGGIGEGLGALARALSASGIEVTVLLPHHAQVAVDLPPHEGTIQVGPHAFVARTGRVGPLEIATLDAPLVTGRADLYGHDMNDDDNARRWGAFCRAAVEVAAWAVRKGSPFDVVHAHEWPCAMVPYLARERRRELGPTRTVLTMHNLAHQGVFGLGCLDALGLGPEHASPDRLGFHGHVNFLRGGIVSADALTTVSPTYAREILTPPDSEMLEDVLGARASDLVGLLNGIDDEIWDPRSDEAIAARFGPDDRSGKAACKRALQRELGLVESERPLVACVGRVVEQKGSDWIAEAISPLARAGVDVVVAGTGDASLVAALERAAAAEPERARYLGYVDDARVHRIVAGADLLAMPSRFEPCGIVQMYALRYGAAPVVTRRGGLADTVEDADDALARGTGFVFDEPSSAALVRTVERAVRAMRTPAWSELVRRGMSIDSSWRRRARAYADLYARVAGRPPRR